MSDLPKKEGRKAAAVERRDGYLPSVHREMPNSLNAERGLLACCAMRPDLIDEMVKFPPEIFWHPPSATIFRALLAMRDAGKPIDFITLATWLKRQGLPENATEEEIAANTGELEKAGGFAGVQELFTLLPTAANFEFYLEEVLLCHKCRRIIVECTDMVTAAYSAKSAQDLEDLLEQVETRIFSLRDADRLEADILDTKQLMRITIEQAEARHRARGNDRCVGIPTGFADLDRMMSGFMPEELYIVAARPSQGKSAFAMNVIRHLLELEHADYGVGLFSLEMPAADQGNRLLSDAESIDLQKFRDGFFSQRDLTKLMTAANRFAKANRLHVDATPAISIQSFRVKARRMVKRGVKIIFIDYLQLMRSTSRRAQGNRQEEVAEISALLKATARELRVPIVALCQLSREAEGRKPNLSHLRESGAIEQDADAVLFPYRPEKGEIDPETGRTKEVEEAMIIIGKQRNGPVNEVACTFRGAFARFEGKTQKVYSNNPAERQGYRPPEED